MKAEDVPFKLLVHETWVIRIFQYLDISAPLVVTDNTTGPMASKYTKKIEIIVKKFQIHINKFSAQMKNNFSILKILKNL